MRSRDSEISEIVTVAYSAITDPYQFLCLEILKMLVYLDVSIGYRQTGIRFRQGNGQI
jgi:hypothetical protein